MSLLSFLSRIPGPGRRPSTAAGPNTDRAAGSADASLDDHLADAPDGCGCAEIWEHLSERRDGG